MHRVPALPALLFAALVSCAPERAGSPALPIVHAGPTRLARLTIPPVRLSEIHYDNTGGDVGEAIEVSGSAGTDLTGWSVVLYNGNGGASYDTRALDGALPTTCGDWGVLVLSYPTNGIQNGDPDGIALVDASGGVIEFLSYEGTFIATNGPAQGLRSRDIGVREAGNEPITGGVRSLRRDGDDVWHGPDEVNSFGACNDAPPAPVPVASVDVAPATITLFAGSKEQLLATAFDASATPIPSATVTWASSVPDVATVSAGGVVSAVGTGDTQITATATGGASAASMVHVDEQPPLPTTEVFVSELHYDNDGSDSGEAIEVEGPAGAGLAGWRLVLYNGNGGASYDTKSLSGAFPSTCGGRGVLVVTYPSNGIQNGSPDGIALVNAAGEVVEFISYEGAFRATDGPALGRLSIDLGVSEASSTPPGRSLQRDAIGWYGPAVSSFGACNVAPQPFVSITGRVPSDPPLPVGFEDQLFATLNDGRGGTTPSPVVWSSETADVASIDADGVVHVLTAGTAVLRATTPGGATGTIALPTIVATASTTASYAGNTEFGVPTDADPSDDFIVRRDQYTTSFNRTRGIPNWVSYDLEATHFGAQDRCDCFTFDPALPADFARYTTADYTGAGEAAGYGIDRGHLARSFDRTSASLDNATTFYFTNIVPQASDNNQGPWAAMEIAVGDRARFDNKEVYVVAGASGSKGTVKAEGRITIPAYMWKVVVVMPRDQGLSDVHSFRDVEVIAVIMPNEPGIRDVPWEDYRTTVNGVEALSGYDLLALPPDAIEQAVESGVQDALAAVDALVQAGALSAGNANSLTAKLSAAAAQLDRGNAQAGRNQLNAALNEVDALVRSGRLGADQAAALRDALGRLMGPG